MATPPRARLLGLSPRARKFVFPLLALTTVIILVGTVLTRSSGSSTGPVVGSDLHSVGEMGNSIFVGGHGGAENLGSGGRWTQITTLDDKDIMGWAQTDETVLAGGHAGLYRSPDDGATFAAVPGLPVSDVHALGASGDRVYVASPESGVIMSEDGGSTFAPVSADGRDFMGTIWVDPNNSDVAVAPSMQSGAVKTIDGGATWAPLGSSPGSMSVAVDSSGRRVAAIGMDGAEVSKDGGATWQSFDVPRGTSAAVYTSEGDLLLAALSGERAQIYRSVSGEWRILA